MKSKIVHDTSIFVAMSDALASFFEIFTGDKSFDMGKLKHADIYIGNEHYKARGKMLNSSRVNECFRLSLEDDSENEKHLVLRRLVPAFVSRHPNCKGLLKRDYELFHEFEMEKCPHIIKLIDYIEEEDALISELVPGLSLDLFVKQNPEYYFKRRTTIKMLKQLITTIGFLHDRGMSHLDISPACILVKSSPEHDIMLLNTGLAAAIHDEIPLGPLQGADLPPEMQQGGPYDKRTDIWEIGKIIKMIIQVRKQDPTRASNHLKLIAIKCMKKNPADRYHDVYEILHDIEVWEHLYDNFGAAGKHGQKDE